MKLGSLFDGIGGFPYSASKYGFEPVWASEIEPFPVKVTQKHFPGMKHLGDITQINGGEIEPVDIITFGSPCQDLSVAGKREGLAGERSGLFSHAVRIIREMRTATGGKCPRFAVWENVPGAFSSNKGEDFRAVLEEIAEAEIPMPRSGKWATAGMVRTETADIAWRTLDAQHHGVPQRRRRIFLVADFRGQCAGEILFVESCLRGHSAESREAGQEAAGDVGDGIAEPNCLTPWDCQSKRIYGVSSKWPTLHSGEGGGAKNQAVLISRINSTPEGIAGAVSSKWAKGTGGPAGDECYNLVAVPQLYDMTHADEVMRPVEKGIAPTLNSRMGTGGNQVPVMLQRHAVTTYWDGGQVSDCPDCSMLSKGQMMPEKRRFPAVMANYAVRRLTPTECLRLQGFPDWWLDIEGASDTAKYRSIGNSVAIPVVDFVLGGISEVINNGASG